MSAAKSPTSALPSRQGTQMTKRSLDSDDDAIPGEDTTEVTRLFSERLKAWKHATGYLEDYISATEKLHHSQGKEYEKVLKSVTKPLKEGEHFAQDLGGVAGFFDNLRSNTQGIANSHTETAKTLKGSVLPVFERLHSEIKNKTKELTKGAGKGSKAVEKARQATQKHIEMLGQHTASFDSTGGKVSASDDPYVLQRGVIHRLHRQVIEENANRQDLLAVQNNFASFEAHIIQTIQNGMGQFNTIISKQADLTKNMYGDVIAVVQRIPADFEWERFLMREAGTLIDPHAAPRSVESVQFPNQNHRATQPMIAGSMDRKTKMLRRFETNYYVLSPSKFLHEFKSDDNVAKDPVPDLSLFLPDCVVGAVDGEKFTIKGKDVSKSKMGIGIHTSHDYTFKAHTAADAMRWYEIIRSAAGQITNEPPAASLPSSPVSPSTGEGENFGTIPPPAHQESGTTRTTHAAPAASSEKVDFANAPSTTHPAAAPASSAPAAATHPAPTEAAPAVTHPAPTEAGPTKS